MCTRDDLKTQSTIESVYVRLSTQVISIIALSSYDTTFHFTLAYCLNLQLLHSNHNSMLHSRGKLCLEAQNMHT